MPRSRSTAVRAHPPPLAARFDLARQLDRPAKQQQFPGQCGLAGVRMLNDRKRAPAQISSVRVLVPNYGVCCASSSDGRWIRRRPGSTSTMPLLATAY
jgi:hypothetical protein